MANAKSFTDDYLLYLLAQASAEASAQFHGALKKRGVPVLNWRILASLHPQCKLTVGNLASQALANQTTVTRAIDRMERDGLVKRNPVASDRRQVLVSLTTEGRKLSDQLTEMAKTHEREILSRSSDQEVENLKKALNLLRGKI